MRGRPQGGCVSEGGRAFARLGVGRASYMGEGSACDVHGAGCVMGVWAEGEKRLEAGVGQGLGR